MSDPYATLNVPQDASREDIRASFSRAARSIHPDKAASGLGSALSAENSKAAANEAFADVDEAWKILGDDQMREAYDRYGFAGTEALQTLRTGRPGAAISRKQLADRVDLLHQVGLDQEFQSRSTVRCHLQLSELINFARGRWGENVSMFPGLQHLLIEQSAVFQPSPKDVVTITAVAGSARRWKKPSKGSFGQNAGGKELTQGPPTLGSLSLTHTMMRGMNSFEYSCTGFAVKDMPPRVTLKGSRPLRKGLTGEIGMSADNSTAGLSFGLAKYLTSETVGHLSLGFGSDDGVGVGVRHESAVSSFLTSTSSDQRPSGSGRQPNGDQKASGGSINRVIQSNFQLRASDMNGIVWASTWSEPITRRSRVKSTFHFSLANIVLELESIRVLSERSKISGSVSVGLQSGVSFKLKVLRAGNKYEFPILVSPRVTLSTALLTGAIPMAVQYILRRILRPIRRRSKEKRLETLRELSRKARIRARNQMMLMRSASDAIKASQLKQDGLVVLLARYGSCLNEEYDWRDDELWANIDVTVQLNFFVNGSTSSLDLKEGTKAELLGFYNPSIGSKSKSDVFPEVDVDEMDEEEQMDKAHKNQLFVRYLFRGMTYEKVFNDSDRVHLPHPDAVRIVAS